MMCQRHLVIGVLYRRFNLWSKKGVLIRVFRALRYEPDLEWEFIDGSIVKAHQHSTGARTADSEALREKIRDKNSIPVIPRKKNSKVGNGDID